MNEQVRQAYLKAMDIQPYFPRQVLVGAKASPVYELPLASPIDAVPAADSAPPQSASSAKRATEVAGLDAIEALRAGASIKRSEAVTAQRQQPEASASTNETEASEQTQDSLSFTLRYYRINEKLAVLDEVPTQGSERLNAESLLLMQAILRALGEQNGSTGVKPEEFVWPLRADYSMKHSPEVEAAKAVSGFLQMRKETDGFGNLLVFAGQLEGVLLQDQQDKALRDFESGKGYFLTVTHSLASMLAVPALKRDVWQHLQALRKRVSS